MQYKCPSINTGILGVLIITDGFYIFTQTRAAKIQKLVYTVVIISKNNNYEAQ